MSDSQEVLWFHTLFCKDTTDGANGLRRNKGIKRERGKTRLNTPHWARNIPAGLKRGNGLKGAPLHERDRVYVYTADLCRNSFGSTHSSAHFTFPSSFKACGQGRRSDEGSSSSTAGEWNTADVCGQSLALSRRMIYNPDLVHEKEAVLF